MNCKALTTFLCLAFLPQITNAEFTVEQDNHGVKIKLDGQLFTEYVLGESNKPYFWPIIGPDNKAMTRAYPMRDVDGEKQDHPHHRSFYFGHQRINEFDTWHEKLTLIERAKGDADKLADSLQRLGSTETTEIRLIESQGDHATLETTSSYKDSEGRTLLKDERRFTFRVDEETDSRIIDVELKFLGAADSVSLHDAKDAGFSLRVAHSICVDAGQGGRIANSEGHIDKDAWGKRAKWCDFNGPIDGETMGIAILNHPSSFRYPTPWHARSYGLFTANPFGLKSVAQSKEDGIVELSKDETFTLRYRVIFHRGNEKSADIEKAFNAYASEEY